MKPNAGRGTALALALCLLLAACGGQGALPSNAPPPREAAARAAEPLPPAGSPSAPPEAEAPGREALPPPEAKAPVSGEEAPAPPEEVSGEGKAPAVPARPEDGALAEDIVPALESLEKTDWRIVSIDANDYGIVEGPHWGPGGLRRGSLTLPGQAHCVFPVL